MVQGILVDERISKNNDGSNGIMVRDSLIQNNASEMSLADMSRADSLVQVGFDVCIMGWGRMGIQPLGSRRAKGLSEALDISMAPKVMEINAAGCPGQGYILAA